jgi:hypothetical protein
MALFARRFGAVLTTFVLFAACHTVSGLDELEVIRDGAGGAGGAGSGAGGGDRPPCEAGDEEELRLEDDATIDQVQPTINLNGNFLLVGPGYRALLGFEAPDDKPIHHAELCLSTIPSSEVGNMDVDVHAIGEGWAEEGVTWAGPYGDDTFWEGESGHPLEPVLWTEQVTPSSIIRYCWDVSAHMIAVAESDAPFFGFILTSSAGIVAAFEDRELFGEPPNLVVNYCAPPGP